MFRSPVKKNKQEKQAEWATVVRGDSSNRANTKTKKKTAAGNVAVSFWGTSLCNLVQEVPSSQVRCFDIGRHYIQQMTHSSGLSS